MATTTNYGWTTPDDTALVKDGAAAIRSLGTSVDTTTKNLNPSTTLGDIEYRSSTANTNTRLPIGTTNQALTVVGGVPTWAASAASVMTTKGDLLSEDATGALARLAVGANDTVLTADSTTATGLKWAAAGGATTLSQIASGSLSGSSTVISGLTQDNIQLIIGDVTANSNQILRLRINSNSTSNYFYTVNLIQTTSPASDYSTYLTTSPNNAILLSDGYNMSQTNSNKGFVVNFTNCKATGMTYFWFSSRFVDTASVNCMTTGQGYFGVAAQVTSLEIFMSSGSFTGGTYKVIGG